MIKHRLTFSIALIILLVSMFTSSLAAEYIDGPANLREAPQGKKLISLNHGAQVRVLSFSDDWYFIAFHAAFKKTSMADNSILSKNAILFDVHGNEIGRALDNIKLHEAYLKGNVYATTLKAYTHKDNIVKKEVLNDILENLKRGDWLNEKIYSSLIKTKSSLIATGKAEISYFSIAPLDEPEDEYAAYGVYNFHEGAGVFVFSEIKPTENRDVFMLTNKPGNPYRRLNEAVLRLGKTTYIEGDGDKYVHLRQGVDNFFNEILLAGDYVDEEGRGFVFSVSRVAEWPEKSFWYKVGTEHIMRNDTCSFFYRATSTGDYFHPAEEYHFHWKNNDLHIYKNSMCSGKPLHVLKRK